MRHTKRGFGDLAGGVGVRIDSKRLKLNPDTSLGRHNSLRYRTVGANAIIQLFEANRRNPGTATDQYKEFRQPEPYLFWLDALVLHATGLHTSTKCPPGTVPALHEP